jgi:similar to stage IV sporulation protein
MLNALLNRLRGQVRLRIECAFPERVLNLCSARAISFWDLTWESPTAFTCRLARRDYGRLRQAAERLDCTLTVEGREGAPFFFHRFRHRPALAVGVVGCGLALLLGSFFIWDFEVEGNETVPTERILRALEENGVTIGSFGLSLDGADLRNRVLLEIPELSWLTVNVSGCRAVVQVRERTPAPTLWDETSPTNVVARRAGLVLELQALNGAAAVLPGSAVTEGQLLISGVEDTDTFGARMLAGLGSVRARTWYSLTTRVPLTAAEKRYTGREKTLVSLTLGKRRVKFFSNSSIQGEKCDKLIKRHPWTLLGVPLPVTLVTEVCRFYETADTALDPAQAEQLGKEILTAQLQSMVAPYGTVSSTLCTSRQQGDVLEVTLSAECVEEIGVIVPILTEEPGD